MECPGPGEVNLLPTEAFDSAKSGSAVGVAVLVALCFAVVEIAIEKGASSILMPISGQAAIERTARRSGGQDYRPLLPRCSRRFAEGASDLNLK
jgi:hypothetical protein